MAYRSLLLAGVLSCQFFPAAMAQKPGGGRATGGAKGYPLPSLVSASKTNVPNYGTAVMPDLGSLPIVVSTQRAEDEKKVEFKAEAILVLVPVVVTDHGTAVRHLAQSDFHILENGKAQKIASFEEITAAPTRLAQPAVPGGFSNMLVGAETPQAVTVLVLDTVNTPYLDQKYGREQLLKTLAHGIGSSQPVALVMITSRGLEILQDFTQDSRQLVATLQKVTGEMPLTETDTRDAVAAGLNPDYSPTRPVPPGDLLRSFLAGGDPDIASFHQGNAVATTLQAFLDLAWALSGIHGHKSVIWLTGSFPFVLDSPSAVPGGSLSILYERTFAELAQANISVYPVDVRGLAGPATDISSGKLPTPATLHDRSWLHADTLETLTEVAAMTGGHAFVNTNDLASAFQRALQDSSSFYMLEYYLDTSDRQPGWRKLKVTVDRGGAEVRSRSGFFVTNATANPALSRNIDLNFALLSPFNATGLPLEVNFLGESGKGKQKEVTFRIHIPPSGMSVAGAKNEFDMDFIALAAATNSKLRPSLAQNMRGRVPDSQLANVKTNGFGFQKAIELAPGQYLLRFVVRDNLSGRVGSVSAPIAVR
jgi:VWFA-related protein